jgi:hypothetical protein
MALSDEARRRFLVYLDATDPPNTNPEVDTSLMEFVACARERPRSPRRAVRLPVDDGAARLSGRQSANTSRLSWRKNVWSCPLFGSFAL